jgi:hypothetical protein
MATRTGCVLEEGPALESQIYGLGTHSCTRLFPVSAT